ncbi:gluconokinase [Pseudarthrobacter sp. L1SW]|uniref:gluconokinase n=1 Tax=Pseudarthrobacter sp. L1SW TaxID=2851598 RepID=UPI001E580068|nr:gluconokinase [Pseudarthrobacter sp. L1SW]UEL28119.1 gluconokinase [Pseudarthrobacter sp. L1SW]
MHSPIVVMGVSGSGKSTVGAALAARLGARFKDADDLHPLPNVEKMATGTPLTDEDRWPWLRLVGAELAAEHPHGIVVACSALKRAYRDAIRAAAPSTRFILLTVDPSVLKERLVQRPGHFMPPSLLTSQLETLEALETAEAGMAVTSEGGIEAVADRILADLGQGQLTVPAGADQNAR